MFLGSIFPYPDGMSDGVGLGLIFAFALGPLYLYTWFDERSRSRQRTMQLGSDGLRVAKDFVPWSDVLDIVQESEGVRVVCRTQKLPVLDLLDVEGFEKAAMDALAAYRSAPPPPDIDALRVRVETSDERAARLAELRGRVAGYRGTDPDGVDLDALEALLRNPAADSSHRQEAAKLLKRLDPSRLERSQVEVEALLNTAL